MNWEDKHIKNLFEEASYKGKTEPTDQDWQCLHKRMKENTKDRNSVRPVAWLVLKYAAILTVIVGISGLGYYFMQSQDKLVNAEDQVVVANKQSNIIIKKDISNPKSIKKDSANHPTIQRNGIQLDLEKSSLFENLIAANYRNNSIEVVAPILNQQFSLKQKIAFKFAGDISMPLILKIYNNKGKKIHTTTTFQSNNFTLNLALSAGLYYWKLEGNTNLLYTGKFLVK